VTTNEDDLFDVTGTVARRPAEGAEQSGRLTTQQGAVVLREVLVALRAEAKVCGLSNDDTAAMLEAATRAVFDLRPESPAESVCLYGGVQMGSTACGRETFTEGQPTITTDLERVSCPDCLVVIRTRYDRDRVRSAELRDARERLASDRASKTSTDEQSGQDTEMAGAVAYPAAGTVATAENLRTLRELVFMEGDALDTVCYLNGVPVKTVDADSVVVGDVVLVERPGSVRISGGYGDDGPLEQTAEVIPPSDYSAAAMTPALLMAFRHDLENVTDLRIPAWLVDGAKLCAATLAAVRGAAEVRAREFGPRAATATQRGLVYSLIRKGHLTQERDGPIEVEALTVGAASVLIGLGLERQGGALGFVTDPHAKLDAGKAHLFKPETHPGLLQSETIAALLVRVEALEAAGKVDKGSGTEERESQEKAAQNAAMAEEAPDRSAYTDPYTEGPSEELKRSLETGEKCGVKGGAKGLSCVHPKGHSPATRHSYKGEV
jgi:hypothetical protein